MRYLRSSTCLLATATLGFAQATVVSPAIFTNAAAPGMNTDPLGSPALISPAMRYLSIHDDLKGKVGFLKGIALRPTENVPTTPVSLVMEVRVSTAAVTAAAAVPTFDMNHGADKMTVVPANTPFSFPGMPAALPVGDFVFQVPFTSTFLFLGAGGIAWEMLISSRTSANSVALDAFMEGGMFTFAATNVGTGCIATGRQVVASASSSYAPASSSVTLTADTLTALAPGALVLGLSVTSWGGLGLPIVLPGTTGYRSLTCTVYTDARVTLPQASTQAGTLSQTFSLPLSAATVGAYAYHYGFTLDSAANAFGAVTSDARLTWFGDGKTVGGACRVVAPTSATAATGTRQSIFVVTAFMF